MHMPAAVDCYLATHTTPAHACCQHTQQFVSNRILFTDHALLLFVAGRPCCFLLALHTVTLPAVYQPRTCTMSSLLTGTMCT